MSAVFRLEISTDASVEISMRTWASMLLSAKTHKPVAQDANTMDEGASRRRLDQLPASASSALHLVTLLGERGRLRVTEAAKELHVAPSTASRLLGVLGHWGFALKDEDRSYIQGPAFIRFSLMGSTSETLRLMVQSHLRMLASRVGETTHLTVLEGTTAKFIHSAEGPSGLRVASRVGALFPAHCTSGGKALLAELSEEELRIRYGDDFPRIPTSRIQTLQQLLDQLARVRRLGIAINCDESEPGISAIGIALHHRSQKAVAALSISVPSVRFRTERLPELARALKQTGSVIEVAM